MAGPSDERDDDTPDDEEGAQGSAKRDDRDLWRDPRDGPRAVRLLQGYAWHPRSEDLDLRQLLPEALLEDVHLLVDPLPQAPFAFFEDGTLSATQQVYQVTVLAIVTSDQDPAALLPAAADELGPLLDATPPGVGWQLMEDLRGLD